MSTQRFGANWADVDEDDEETNEAGGTAKFETTADEHGIKSVISYEERDGKTYKVTRRIKQTIIHKRVNAAMNDRKELAKFGKAATSDPMEELSHVKKQEDEVRLELTKKAVTLAAKDDAEDKFLDDAFKATENLFKEKKAWADINREQQIARDKEDGPPRPVESELAQMIADRAKMAADRGLPTGNKGSGPATYVPPSMRDEKGKGKGKDQGSDASLRVTNLSEDAAEGDLRVLFERFGRTQRVYLARDMETKQSRGFAFVTYYNRADGQRAINALHGHGYDNLILQVQWAKPRQ